ncbi:DUF1501 domain-containing protein [Rubellimicrobium sp. CFH 75288]|uniref:DUF1501 domain-containing protein n=1 Tax=Rubellimicrobium sp. CFH 75288 TaxID=2697034 RepID=UPI001411C7CA|nr:DUF1501 domain-containing protein [Rubellimicrobium sp. CFH 75288]NAZ35895.1 DUF1501 domain-containing protein [Rubellimicrobium sp. CFH 75288]
MAQLTRRGFLGALALGCSAAASPLVTPVVFASAPWESRLVVLILRGAMDGLDAVRPVGDPDYAALRPALGQGGLPVGDGFWALHPALEPLLPLWQAGEMGAVHAVSTPYRDRRSHFDGQDILEAGSGGSDIEGVRDGWLNRMLGAVPGVRAETAFAIGRENLLILSGPAPVSRWSPDARLRLSPQARRLLEIVHHEDPLFRAASDQAIAIVDGLEAEGMERGGGGGHVRLAEFAASRLRGDTRIASFSLGGWDTHFRQAAPMAQALGRLSETILTLREGLGPVWSQTAILCLTEFGRTARENGTQGTDHGTGGAMLFAGGALRGGRVVTDWPGLDEASLYAGRDLSSTRDVRAHAAWVMRGLFGLDRGVLEGAVFPRLEMGADPGLVL